MTGALVLLAITTLTGLILWAFHSPSADDAAQPVADEAGECCGLHEVCEKKGRQMIAPEYFDDEELDRFAGRTPDSYTDDETEQFRDVLFTLLPEDVEPWGFSLQARGIEMPAPVHDEWVMLATEYRNNKSNSNASQ
ncbi:MAG: phospholipase [Duncaniella sp.]|nr:phospholipase [Duncaniella sp.]